MFSFFFEDSIKLTPSNCWQRLSDCLKKYFIIQLKYTIERILLTSAIVYSTLSVLLCDKKKTITQKQVENEISVKFIVFFFIPLPWDTFGQIVSQAFVGLTFLLFQVNGMSSVTHIAMKDDIMILGDVTGALYLMNTSKKTMKRCSIWLNWKWQVVNMRFGTYTLNLMFL